jgi:hypothetical protein
MRHDGRDRRKQTESCKTGEDETAVPIFHCAPTRINILDGVCPRSIARPIHIAEI